MRVEVVDIESFLMADGMAAPPMVCMSWTDGQREKLLVPWEGESPYDVFEKIITDPSALLVNQHIFYDLGILCAERPHLVPLVFKALEEGRIRCMKVREQLIRIAAGQAKFIEEDTDDEEREEGEEEEGEDEEVKMQKTRFDLSAIGWRWLNVEIAKDDTWRKSYALLWEIPLKRWPHSAREYVMNDVRYVRRIWGLQEQFIQETFPDKVLPGEVEANCAAWALHLMKIWGVRTCPEAVEKLKRELQVKTLWMGIGLAMVDPKKPNETPILRKGGTRLKPKFVGTKIETQRRVAVAFEKLGLDVPMTKPTKRFPDGQIKIGGKQLKDSKEPILAALAEYNGHMKILGTYVPRYIEKGITVPITPDWNPLVESFRISCARPNLTNPPRSGDVRGCFKARDEIGMVYVSADFDQAELRSWSQVCYKMFGYSTMGEAFKQGIDPHLKLAADLLKISLDEAIRLYAEGDKEVDDKRQFSKEPNFGLIGGMGWRKFQERAALKGIFLSDEEAEEVRRIWKEVTWPEATEYLDYFSEHYSEPNLIVHPITGFYRGECGYTDGSNHMFQHLTAIGAKQALIDLSRECYTDRRSVLWGARPIILMHDEIFGEIREDIAHEGAIRWGQVMHDGMASWVRDVPTKCTPVLSRRLYKGAKPVYVDGKLVPSKPVMIDGKKKWVPDLLEDNRRLAA